MSDEATIELIQENVYQQYFIGLSQYQYEPVFDPSLFVTIRKRIGVEAFDAMVQELISVAHNPCKASFGSTVLPIQRKNIHEEQRTISSYSLMLRTLGKYLKY